ncbi:DUF6683 family protein [Deinococcus maricopensis]|uniref:DUF2059 domain-containing protein n=1 Tax=Deinococcus maricopensis (strain DSM 21211 / LMG 22137 / NRRL B-23946 / LB-34) TaxID=709986 RepID=E8UBQ0_DEIML|nr:DUF6683 family protein [Deinococcus maricopensis]ADV68489.1 hypothetical protein Deima_2860 [Deinococcus maricopensis DSM 21211]
MRRTLLCLALACAAPAAAQDAFLNMFNSASQAALKGVGGSITAAPKAPAAPATVKTLDFKSSPQVSQQVRELFIKTLVDAGKKNGKVTPQLEAQLRAEFNKIDIVKTYAQALEPKGFRMNNLATGVAVWLITSFEILNDGREYTDAQNRKVYDQLASAMSASPDVARMKDADKQKMTELLLWMTAFQLNDLAQAQAGVEGYSVEAVQAQARDLLQTFRLDPAQLAITDQGLTRRGQ